MNHATEDLMWSFSSALGAFLGYALHVVMSWGEWRKIGGNKSLGLLDFLRGDPPGQISGIITVLIVYFSLPVLHTWQGVSSAIGFAPGLNFLSAAITAFASQGIGVKLRNIARKLNGDS